MEFPLSFTQRLSALLGSESAQLLQALQTDPVISIRINRRKPIVPPASATPVPWCSSGYYLPERPSFIADPHLHGGRYYVQEASSMFLAQVIGQLIHDPVRCLDLCAAPGGKSSLLADALPEGSVLVSNEVIRSRCHVLDENLTKWGAPEVIVTNSDPAAFGGLRHCFDLIVTDVPCSGEGMFRKDPDSMQEWSVDNVKLCASRSRRIIQDVWEALRPGGFLVYSTCTFNVEENEENMAWFAEQMGAHPIAIETPPAWNVTGPLKGDLPICRFLPGRSRGEGFSLFVLQKAEGPADPLRPKREKPGKTAPALLPDSAKVIIKAMTENNPSKTAIYGSTLYLQSEAVAESVRLFAPSLSIVHAGIRLGEIKGRDFIPSTDLALSASLPDGLFPQTEVDRTTALQYLRKEAIVLPDATPRGFVIITCEGTRLGFVKNIGSRSNNLYPQEWRIRKSLSDMT